MTAIIIEVPTSNTTRLIVRTGAHPGFPVELVRPAVIQPPPSKIAENFESSPVAVDGEQDIEVEATGIRKRGPDYHSCVQALVKWTRYPGHFFGEMEMQNNSALGEFERMHSPIQENGVMAEETAVRIRGTPQQCEREGRRKKPSLQKRSKVKNSAWSTRIRVKDDKLLIKLKEERRLTWKQIGKYFRKRSVGSLQAQYRDRLKDRRLRPL